jgi:AraC family transcriptional regulator, transcriptional activator of pobA
MGPKSAEIAVYPVSIFGCKDTFWIGDLGGLLTRYPHLEFPHKQSFYMFLVIQEAKGLLILDKHPIQLDEPKIICIKPNSVCSLQINNHAKGKLICFNEMFYSLRYNNNVLSQFSFIQKEAVAFIRISPIEDEKWLQLLNAMEREQVLQLEGFEKVLRSYLNIFLYEIDRKFHPQKKLTSNYNREDKIIQFEKLIELNYATQKQPSYYAGQLHITTNHLNKLCQTYRGYTSGEMIRKRVIIEAQRLLHFTNLNVSEVAYQLGFESPSYFITFFKKDTGITPEYFRKNNK